MFKVELKQGRFYLYTMAFEQWAIMHSENNITALKDWTKEKLAASYRLATYQLMM